MIRSILQRLQSRHLLFLGYAFCMRKSWKQHNEAAVNNVVNVVKDHLYPVEQVKITPYSRNKERTVVDWGAFSKYADRRCYRKDDKQRSTDVADYLFRYILRKQCSSRYSDTWQTTSRGVHVPMNQFSRWQCWQWDEVIVLTDQSGMRCYRPRTVCSVRVLHQKLAGGGQVAVEANTVNSWSKPLRPGLSWNKQRSILKPIR